MLYTKTYGTVRVRVHCITAAFLNRFYRLLLTGWISRRRLALVCALLLFLIIFYRRIGRKQEIRHIVIMSATHFRHDDRGVDVFNLVQSPFESNDKYQYDKNVLLFVSQTKFRKQESHLWCRSSNGTHELKSTLLPTVTSPPLPFCKWTLYIGVCSVVNELHIFKIVVNKQDKTKAIVPFRQPVREQYDVVACFSPLFLNEHWQLLLTSLEVRRAHGLSLQVFYIYSIRSPLMDILRAYEKHGFVALEKWARIDLGDSGGLDYDPNYELVWRNQEGAHTDCFLKYKVATRYIIVSDIDDILLPRIAPTYIEEFQLLLEKMHNPVALVYDRQQVDVFTSSHPRNFSLFSVLHNAIVTNASETGKHVALTDNVITVSLHWPGLKNLNGELKIDFRTNFMYHFRNWFYDVQARNYVDPDFAQPKGMGDLMPLRSFLGNARILEYQRNFELLMNESFRDIFVKLYSTQIYYPIIDACYNEIFYKHYRAHKAVYKCPGPIRCTIPRIPGVRCISSQIHYRHVSMTSKMRVHYAIDMDFVESNNGCSM